MTVNETEQSDLKLTPESGGVSRAFWRYLFGVRRTPNIVAVSCIVNEMLNRSAIDIAELAIMGEGTGIFEVAPAIVVSATERIYCIITALDGESLELAVT